MRHEQTGPKPLSLSAGSADIWPRGRHHPLLTDRSVSVGPNEKTYFSTEELKIFFYFFITLNTLQCSCWSATSGPRRPDVLQIVSQHPQSNLGPSHWPHHQQLQGPGDFRGRRRPGPEDGTSKPHRGWAEDDAMLRWGTAVDDGPIGGQSWLRWDGDLSNHSLDCGSNSEIWFSLWYEFKWKTKLLLQNH